MLTILTLIVCAYFAGSEHSGLALAALVFITVVRYGYGLALDLLPPHVDPGRPRPPEKGMKSFYAMVVGIGLALLSMPDSSHIVLKLSTIVVMSGMLEWSRLDKREQTTLPATAQRADTDHHGD